MFMTMCETERVDMLRIYVYVYVSITLHVNVFLRVSYNFVEKLKIYRRKLVK